MIQIQTSQAFRLRTSELQLRSCMSLKGAQHEPNTLNYVTHDSLEPEVLPNTDVPLCCRSTRRSGRFAPADQFGSHSVTQLDKEVPGRMVCHLEVAIDQTTTSG